MTLSGDGKTIGWHCANGVFARATSHTGTPEQLDRGRAPYRCRGPVFDDAARFAVMRCAELYPDLTLSYVVRDRETGAAETLPGDLGKDYGTCWPPEDALGISDGGRYVLVATCAALVAQDTNAVADAYIFDRQTATYTLASIVPGATPTTCGLGAAALSGDGRLVAFEGCAGERSRVFVRDLTAASTTLVSVAPSGANTGFPPSFELSGFSHDGRWVTFTSGVFAGNGYVAGTHTFLRNRVTMETATLVHVAPYGSGPSPGCVTGFYGAAISDAGDVAVSTCAVDDPDDAGGTDIYLRPFGGELRLASSGRAGRDAMSPRVSRDGSRLVFVVSPTNSSEDSGAVVEQPFLPAADALR